MRLIQYIIYYYLHDYYSLYKNSLFYYFYYFIIERNQLSIDDKGIRHWLKNKNRKSSKKDKQSDNVSKARSKSTTTVHQMISI